MAWNLENVDSVTNIIKDYLNLDSNTCQTLIDKELNDFVKVMPEAFRIKEMSLYEASVLYLIQQSFKKHKDETITDVDETHVFNTTKVTEWLINHGWKNGIKYDGSVFRIINIAGNFISIGLQFSKFGSVYFMCEGSEKVKVPEDVIQNYESRLSLWLGHVGFRRIAHHLAKNNMSYGREFARLADAGFICYSNNCECFKIEECNDFIFITSVNPVDIIDGSDYGVIQFYITDKEYCVYGTYIPERGSYSDSQLDELCECVNQYKKQLLDIWKCRREHKAESSIAYATFRMPLEKQVYGSKSVPVVVNNREDIENTIDVYCDADCHIWIFVPSTIDSDVSQRIDNMYSFKKYLSDTSWERSTGANVYTTALDFGDSRIIVYIEIVRLDRIVLYTKDSGEHIAIPSYVVQQCDRYLNSWIREIGFQYIARQGVNYNVWQLADFRFMCLTPIEYFKCNIGALVSNYIVIKLKSGVFSEMIFVAIVKGIISEYKFSFTRNDLDSEQMFSVMETITAYINMYNNFSSDMTDEPEHNNLLHLVSKRTFSDMKYVQNLNERYGGE